MSAARTIELFELDGSASEVQLEVRPLIDGRLMFRLFEKGCRAGIGAPGAASTSEIASSLISENPLILPSKTGDYTMWRQGDYVQFTFKSFDHCWDREWLATLSDVLVLLKSVPKRAA